MIICIVGPSGVGKTKLSIELTKKYDGIVVNCDATQIYKELNIGSAKITEEEKEGIKHYLLDLKSPLEEYSVRDYQIDARKILKENENKNIIVCGGTGLYVKALFYNYEFNERENKTYDKLSNDDLYQMAKYLNQDVDIHPNNRVRLINFINNEGKVTKADKSLYDVIYVGLTMDRSKVYDRANQRVDKMFQDGLYDEVKLLYEKYPDSIILRRAIGYKEIISHLKGEISLEEAKDLIKKNTRHYIKRQYTWFNHQLPVNWFNMEDFNKGYDEIISFIESLNSK